MMDPMTSIASALKKDGIIPDIIPPTTSFTPSMLFSITWPSSPSSSDEPSALLGNTLTKASTAPEPKIILTPAGAAPDFDGVPEEESYTLAMVDPDAPSRKDKQWGPFRHWVISGLKPPTISEIESAAAAQSASNKELLSSSTDPLSALTTGPSACEYYPPSPPAGTGPHRYVFLLFRDPPKFKPAPLGTSADERKNWNAMQWADKNGLKLVGANYCFVESD